MIKNGTRMILCAVAAAAALTIGAAAEKQVAVGTVNTEALNFRADPSTDAKIYMTAYQDETVLVLSDDENPAPENWVRVQYKYLTGYMSAQYLTIEPVKDVGLGNGKVTGSVVNLRAAPSTGGDVLLQLAENTTVTVLGVDSGWFKVRYNQKEGYMHPDYIELVKTVSAGSGAQTGGGQGSGSETAEAVPISAAGLKSGSAVVEYSKQFIGVKYVYGGASPKGFDCSGLTYYVYKQFGVTINRGATGQLSNGTKVSRDELQPGDLVFFLDTKKKSSGASHVGIYVGDDQYIHSVQPGDTVRISSLNSDYGAKYYVGARRIFT